MGRSKHSGTDSGWVDKAITYVKDALAPIKPQGQKAMVKKLKDLGGGKGIDKKGE